MLSLVIPSNLKRSMIVCLVAFLAISYVFTGLGVFAADPAVGDSDWAMFHHDLQHSGTSPSIVPTTNNMQWSYATGSYVYSSSAVVDGKVYTGSDDHNVYCLDALSGAFLWNYTTGGVVRSSPAVVDGKVYIGSYDDKVYCLNASTGDFIWSYTTGSVVSSSPAVAFGTVYVASEDSKIYGLNATSGELNWDFTTGGSVRSSPAIFDGKVYVSSNDNKIYCLDVGGHFVWEYSTSGSVRSSPAVVDGKVYVGSQNGKVYCLQAQIGFVIWIYTTGGPVYSSPAVVDGKVYIGSNDDKVYCLNASTGDFIWSYTTDNDVSYSSPAVFNGKIYVGSFDGRIYCLSAETGSHIWNYTTGSNVYSSPAVVNGKVYVGSWDGKIYCFGSPKSLELSGATGWYWQSNTVVNSVAVWDVNGDGRQETVSGGSFFDGSRNVAQLILWDSINFNVEAIQCWYWTGNTTINSVAVGDVDGDGQIEVVTGGSFFDGTRNVAQLVVWSGSSLSVERVQSWFWTGNTVINSVVLGDVDGDGQTEIVTGGYFNDGTRNNAQLVEWNGSNLAVDRLTNWYWTSNTVINSVALGNVDDDAQIEVVTGGYYNDGTRDVAQLIEWNGANLVVDRLTGWYWTGNTTINSVALGDVDGDSQTEIVTGGFFNDGSRNVAQLIEWNGANLTVDRLTNWYWTGNTAIYSVGIGDVDGDGQTELVTGGQFNDGTCDIAQMGIWSGSSIAFEKIKTWYWTGNTTIKSLTVADVNGGSSSEIVSGGAFYDGTRSNSQLTVWGMT